MTCDVGSAGYVSPKVSDLGSHVTFVQAAARQGPFDGVTVPGGSPGCNSFSSCNLALSPD